MPRQVTLDAGSARLVLAPVLGGAITALDVNKRPVLRPWSQIEEEGPFALASNILVPFSNRISDGGFTWSGQRYDVNANFLDEPCPLHGDGFQKPWWVEEVSRSSARLRLDNGNIGPWHYSATQVFELTPGSLRIGLTVTNQGNIALPFGFGFHPWFPRDAQTRLSFLAQGVWLEDESYLPTEHIALESHPDWDFRKERPVPDHWINNAYSNWNGDAEIRQGPAYTSVRVTASGNLDHAIVHSVGRDCGFVCFEPVSHCVDAVNAAGAPGMPVLEPGQDAKCWIRLDWHECKVDAS